jgi:hypothetical protein
MRCQVVAALESRNELRGSLRTAEERCAAAQQQLAAVQ